MPIMPTQSPSTDLLSLNSLAPAAPRWLWPPRIPIGSLTLITGDPGTGKSTLALDLAARVTAALPWPVPASRGTPLELTREAGDVIYLGGEDDLAAVTLPRLIAAGGDPARFF